MIAGHVGQMMFSIKLGTDSTSRHDLNGKRTSFGYVSWYDNIAKQDASGVKVMKDAGGE